MTRQELVRRMSIGVVDQLLSSGSNFIALLFGARYLDASEFGRFSLALLSYTVVLGIARALCSESLLVRPGEHAGERRRRSGLATGSACWVGIGAGMAFGAAAAFSSGSLVLSLLILAAVMPGLLVQDTLRYAAFSRSEPGAALASDSIWFVGQVACFMGLIARGHTTPAAMLLAWSMPGVFAGLVQAMHEHTVPVVQHGIRWILGNRDLSIRYAMDYLTGAGAAQVGAYCLVVVAGVAAIGSIRGAQTLFGPANVLVTGITIVLVPEGRRAVQRSTRSLTVLCVGATALFAAGAAVMFAVYLALTPDQGRVLLGSTWRSARAVIVPIGIAAVAGGMVAGAIAGLRSLSAARELLRIRLLTIPTTLALPIGGAVLSDARGLAWGIAASVLWNVVWYWAGYLRALRTYDPEK